jgi:hypothetical protein
MAGSALLIACGALARELVELQRLNHWDHLKIQCLPAELHNTPDRIPAAVEAAITEYREQYEHIFVAYADCGTGGLLDRVLEQHGIERIPGAHCYEFYAGPEVFRALCEAELGTYYLTDFLVRHFDRLVVRGLGLDRHPELLAQYFGNYRKVVYLAQGRADMLSGKARDIATYLGLDYDQVDTGLAPVESVLSEKVVQWQS